MKTFTKRLLGLALVGLLLGACSQTATFEDADLMNEQAVAKAGFKLDPFGIGNENARTYAATDCEDFCIDPENPEYSVQTATVVEGARTVNYTVYNTLTGFNVNWSYSSTNSAARKVRITVSGAGFSSAKVYNSETVSSSGSGSHIFPFDASWAACGEVTVVAQITDNDGEVKATNTTTYNLIGECSVGCDDEFTAVTTCSEDSSMRSVTFTFTAGDDAIYKIQGGLTAFISDVIVDGASVINVTGNGNNIISWTGSLDECDVKIITVTWKSTNGDPEIIGDWSVEKDGVKILVLAPLECNDNGEGYAPII